MTEFFPATRMPDRDWWSALWPDPEAVLEKLEVPREEPAVDLCCGDGYFTAPLARLVTPARVYALELDPEILGQAREYVAGQGETNCVFVQDDARNLTQHVPVPVGFVLIANTFHGAPDKTDLARKVHEVLGPQGRLAIVNWHPMRREQTRGSWVNLVAPPRRCACRWSKPGSPQSPPASSWNAPWSFPLPLRSSLRA